MNAYKHKRSAGILGVGLACLMWATVASADPIMFEDHFDNGTMSPEWVSIAGTQWVEDGWLHTQDLDPAWPRESMAVVHKGDTNWTDYTLSLWVDPLEAYGWEKGRVHFRVQDAFLGSDWPHRQNYELHFDSPGHVDPPVLILSHIEADDSGSRLAEVPGVTSNAPMFTVIKVTGPRIRVWLDGIPLIDVVDPSPLLHGGIGISGVWECPARFDDVVVTPEPATLALVGLGTLGLFHRRR